MPGLTKVFPPECADQVLTRSDSVLLLVPVCRRRTNFINAERLDQMKPSGWLLKTPLCVAGYAPRSTENAWFVKT
jgi:phosphoglycerate dehydrogenase-like enzyme